MAYFEIEQQQEIAIVWLDQPDSKVNTLSARMLGEFESLLDRLEQDEAIRGAVLISRKADTFIAGADIEAFTQMKSSDEARALSEQGNALLLRLERLNKPVVAAIHGAALGGGLEVALACHYRIATTGEKTVLGLPEIKLGLLPGGGGTTRLPRQIGLVKALDLLLNGKNIYPKPARRAGLVDELIHPPGLLQAAVAAAREGRRSKPARLPLWQRALTATPAGRHLLLAQARKTVLKKTGGHYPAPLKILEVLQTGLDEGLEAGLQAEGRAFAELHASEAHRYLVRLFLAMQARKHNPLQDRLQAVDKLGMLGAGFMGTGITEVSIEKGMTVVLRDLDQERLAAGMKRLWQDLGRKVQRRIISDFRRDELLARVQTTTRVEDMAHCDMVVEAVFEDLDIKRKVVEELESVLPKDAWIASNTSSLPIGDIAAASQRPERIIGMHYFSPVPKMPLLEIIITDQTAPAVQAAAIDIGIRQGKTPVVVRDGPGFYTTRILAAYMNEALELLAEGVPVEALDRAMKAWGFPVGPVALMDEVGIDVGAHIGRGKLTELFAARGIEGRDTLQKMEAQGLLGRKNGKGFYLYPKRGRKQPNPALKRFFPEHNSNPDQSDWQWRLAAVMVNEAIYCLQEGILQSAEDGDVAAILGLGFPPFRGGPFAWTDNIGAGMLLQRIQGFEQRFGARFRPAELLVEKATNNQRFLQD